MENKELITQKTFDMLIENISIKKTDNQKVIKIKGIANKFNEIDLQNEIVKEGAFLEAIEKRDSYPIMYNHNWSDPIGRTTKLKEIDGGLYVEADLILTKTEEKENINKKIIFEKIENKLIMGLSIGGKGFAKKEKIDGKDINVIHKFELVEISATPTPANLSSIFELREKSLNKLKNTIKYIQKEKTLKLIKGFLKQKKGV